MNMVTVIGNLTADPERRNVTTANGEAVVASFTVAANRVLKDKKYTEYFRVSVWDRMAENACKYLAKGKKVAVCGAVTCRAYTTQDGSPRAQMEITQLVRLEYLTPRGGARNEAQNADGDDWAEVSDDDELPF